MTAFLASMRFSHLLHFVMSVFVCVGVLAHSPPVAAQGNKKPKLDFASGLSDEVRNEIESLPAGVQSYIQHRLAGGTMQGLLDPAFVETWKVGQVGIISYGPTNLAPEKQVFSVSNIVDDRNVLIDDHKVWVEGLTTGNVADGGTVNLQGHFFVVAGNKSYATAAGGQRTVKHVVAVNTKAINGLLGKIVSPHGYRIWTDQFGMTDIAKFRRKSGAKVTLEYLNGKTSSIPFAKLSQFDQEWVNANAEATGKPKE